MTDLKHTLILILIGGIGGAAFITINFIDDNDDKMMTADVSSSVSSLSSSVSPSPTPTKTPVTIVKKTEPSEKRVTKPTMTPTPTPMMTPTPLKTPTPVPTKKPTPTPNPTPFPTPTPKNTPDPTPIPEPTMTPTPEPEPEGIVINEIAWMGTEAHYSDEWIELYNVSSFDVDLSGWTLRSGDNSPNIALEGSISAYGYFLIERTNDDTVSDISANMATSFGKGGLKNDCEVLGLYDPGGNSVDSTACFDENWPAGDNSTKSTMERINPLLGGDNASNWKTHEGSGNGLDADGNPINGTPKAQNS